MAVPADRRAVPTVQIDDALVRVTEWRFAPGAATGWHRHEHPYVVVPMTTGRLALTGPDGETAADLVAGHSYARPEGVEHDVRNANAFEFVFVEIEIKRVPDRLRRVPAAVGVSPRGTPGPGRAP